MKKEDLTAKQEDFLLEQARFEKRKSEEFETPNFPKWIKAKKVKGGKI